MWLDFSLSTKSFSFLSSKYAVEACDINNSFVADLVHCLAMVQASHVICLLLCVADSVTPHSLSVGGSIESFKIKGECHEGEGWGGRSWEYKRNM
jgi:hypothetical protein